MQLAWHWGWRWRQRWEQGHRCSLAVLCIGTCLSSTASLRAAEPSQPPANPAATEGLAAFEAGHFEEATEKLSRALDMADVPTLSLYAARANTKLNHWVRAIELYHLASRLSPASVADVKQLHAQYEADREGAQLLARMPRLTIVVEGAPLEITEVTLDGTPVPTGLFGVTQFVDPGAHDIRATSKGQPLVVHFEIREGETRVATLAQPGLSGAPKPPLPAMTGSPKPSTAGESLSPVNREYAERLGLDDDLETRPTAQGVPLNAPEQAESNSESALRSVGWAAVGVGSTGILLGAATGILAVRKRSSIDSRCVQGVCQMSERSAVDDYNSLRDWSSAGFIAGSVIAAGGVGILLLGAGNKSHESPQLMVGPANVSVRGLF